MPPSTRTPLFVEQSAPPLAQSIGGLSDPHEFGDRGVLPERRIG
jgi:hypothetical protein